MTGVQTCALPISTSFDKEARQADRYPGYRAAGLLEGGRSFRVPEGSYFAMGDNSPNSSDGRFWGTVPASAVVGRPLFVYFPFGRVLP